MAAVGGRFLRGERVEVDGGKGKGALRGLDPFRWRGRGRWCVGGEGRAGGEREQHGEDGGGGEFCWRHGVGGLSAGAGVGLGPETPLRAGPRVEGDVAIADVAGSFVAVNSTPTSISAIAWPMSSMIF